MTRQIELSPEPAPPRELDGMTRVLLVTEERTYQRGLRRELLRQGFAVDSVADGDEAIERCRREAYDVVLLDLSVTGDAGFEICRAVGIVSRPPMVMMLAPANGAQERLAGFEAGADDCVSKPVVVREIAARLRALARRRGTGLQPAG